MNVTTDAPGRIGVALAHVLAERDEGHFARVLLHPNRKLPIGLNVEGVNGGILGEDSLV